MTKRPVVLVVEDNERILAADVRVLGDAGYDVLAAPSVAAARAHLEAASPDAVVLDILLPDGNGLDLIAEIREWTNAPVLIVTALGAKDERLNGLRAGGDDYITKPYDLDELCARVAAFLRREEMHRDHGNRALQHGPLALELMSGRAYLNGQDLLLTQKEFAVLLLLIQNEGQTLPKERIYAQVWKSPMAGDDRAVKTAVSRLRKKLDGSGMSIVSMRGEGYRCASAPEGPPEPSTDKGKG